MRISALLSAILPTFIAGLPHLSIRDIVLPSNGNLNTAPPIEGGCGAVDFYFSQVAHPYVEANSFFWLYPKDTCQQIDLNAPGASSVNRAYVHPSAPTRCGSCTFYQ